MKTIKKFMFGLGILIMSFLFNSCLDDDGYSLDKAWYSIATINPLEDSKAYWLSLDNGTSLWPVATNIPWYNPKENQRAFVVYTLLSDKFNEYDHAIKILDLKTILTKPVAENLGEKNDETYGTDPVSMSEMWIGDGYLNIVFEFYYGGNTVHFINLMENASDDNPYLFEFRHNAYNDNTHFLRKGIVAIDLSSVDTMGEDVELSISFNTFEGVKNYNVEYNSSKNPVSQSRSYMKESFVEAI